MNDPNHTLFYELSEAVAGPGCAVCALVQRGLRRYLEALTAEGVMDQRQRAEIRAARGFCSTHGRMLREARDALGNAIIHRDVLVNLFRDLEGTAHRRPSVGARLRRVMRGNAMPDALSHKDELSARHPCPACIQAHQAERLYVDAFVAQLDQEHFIQLFQASAGLCVPHLRLALRHTPNQQVHERLRTMQLAIWQRLIDELDEFIRKQDHRFQHEPIGPERDAWARAIDLISGRGG